MLSGTEYRRQDRAGAAARKNSHPHWGWDRAGFRADHSGIVSAKLAPAFKLSKSCQSSLTAADIPI